MTAHTLSLTLFLAGCFGTEATSSVPAPGQAAPTSGPGVLQEDPDLRACLGKGAPSTETELHVIGREVTNSSEVLRVVWAEDTRDAAFGSGATLVVDGDACRRLEGPSISEAEWSAARALSASPEVRDRQLAVQMVAAGGVEGLREAIETHRGPDWIRPRECEFDETEAEGLCLGPYEAAAYRRAEIDVPRPWRLDRFSGSADLSRVPDSLLQCVSIDARRESGQVEYIGALPSGPELEHLFVVYPEGWVTYEGEPHVYAVSQDLDGRCAQVGTWRDYTPSLFRLVESPEMLHRWARVEVARAGGPDEYVRAYRAQVQAGGPYACAPEATGSATLCVSGPALDGLRAAGVEVRPWPR